VALRDSFGRFHNYLRVSLTEKCNLRCVYCMPSEGVKLTPRAELMTLEERKRLITMFATLGVNKIRFTGGEPTVSNQLQELIKHSRSCHNGAIKSVGMTSNGLVLTDKLDGLISSGLSSVNISLDTLSETKFATMTRRDKKGLYRVLSSIYSAVSKGLPVKINCVLMRGFNDDEVVEFVKLTKQIKVDCRFIELMPFDGNEWSPKKFMSYFEVLDMLKQQHNVNLQKDTKHPIDVHDTTRWYSAGDDHQGRVGFITSMSSNFCGGCNRLRVTADGKLKVCLFGDEHYSIVDAMRGGQSDSEIIEGIGEVVRQKKAALGGHGNKEKLAETHNRPMILIGG